MDVTQPVSALCSKPVITVAPDTRVEAIAALLEQRNISSVAVAGEGSTLCGVVSTTDLLRSDGRTAREVMHAPVIAVDAAAPLREAAAKMVGARVHRVFVEEGSRALGVLSARDILKVVAASHLPTRLGELMTDEVVTIDLGATIDEGIAALTEANVRGVVVVEGRKPVGVFTHTEAIRARKLPPTLRSGPIEDVISYETICLDVDMPLYRVASYMIAMNVRRILAVENRSLQGVLSGFDLARVVARG